VDPGKQRPRIRIAKVRDDQNPLFLHQGAEFRDMGRKLRVSPSGIFSGSAGIAVIRLLLEARMPSGRVRGAWRNVTENVRIFGTGVGSMTVSGPVGIHTKTGIRPVSLAKK
jgi:hypothetical protein